MSLLSIRGVNYDLSSAEEIKDKLIAASDREGKKRNLQLLWGILVGLLQEREPNFAVTSVCRRLERAGGPKVQSVRNAGGKDFRALIQAFATAAGIPAQKAVTQGKSQRDLALESISDPGMRAVFRQIVAENRNLRNRCDRLASSFKDLSVLAPGSQPPSGTPMKESVHPSGISQAAQVILPPAASSSPLTPQEREALRKGFSPERLGENGWTIQPDGSVEDIRGRCVLPPRFAHAIRRLAEEG